jgi:hypothetical protein
MVSKEDGQFYTMEGIAAAVLMVLTAFLVMSTTSVYTPGDAHIIDMQLEQVGYDALKMMDTQNTYSETQSDLEYFIKNASDPTNKNKFTDEFLYLINTTALINSTDYHSDNIYFEADIYYRLSNDTIRKYSFTHSERSFTGNENAVRVSRWVFITKTNPSNNPFESRNQTVLLEVLLWRN